MSEVVDLLALCHVREISWHFLARQAQRPSGLAELIAGRSSEQSVDATEARALLAMAEGELPGHRESVEKDA